MIDVFRVKSLLAVTLAGLALLSASCARAKANPNWTTDYKKAEEEAKASHKLVFVNFTGSDWCGYCIQFDRMILSQPQFKEYAGKNLVLLEIDFPSQRGTRWKEQSLELKKQNMELARKFEIEAFPTLVVLDADGNALWRYEGAYQGGMAAFLAELDKIRKG